LKFNKGVDKGGGLVSPIARECNILKIHAIQLACLAVLAGKAP
jgi:hypothetical protein